MTTPVPAVRVARATETVMLHDLWLSTPDRAEWAPAEGPTAPLLAELDLLCVDRRLWMALDGDKAVGFAGAGEIDSGLFLSVFGVLQSHRDRGHGGALLSAVVSFGTAANYPAVYAVAHRGGAGHGFLRGNGFIDLEPDRLSPAIATVIAGAGQGERCIVMARPL